MTIHRIVPATLLALAIGALTFWLAGLRIHPADDDKIPPATQHTLDSLARSVASFEARQDSLRTRVIHDTVQSAHFQEAAARATATARGAQARADSLARGAGAAGDSAAAWRRAYEARTAEAVALRETVRQDSLTIAAEVDARRSLALAYSADTLRRLAIEKVNRDLRDAVARLEAPCRIVGPIPCPSRTVAAAGSAALGYVAGRKL